MANVLVVEDDPDIRFSLIDGLSAHGFTVRSTGDGFGALRELTQSPPDAVVLDLGLPDLDGSDALRMMRGISQVPVVIVTARDDHDEIIRILRAGADDYIVKPFSSAMLAARLTAVMRRSARPTADHQADGAWRDTTSREAIAIGKLRIDERARTVHLDRDEIQLTRREFDLLAFLARNADEVVPKRTILTEVWRDAYVDEQTIDVHLSALRRKLNERAARPRYLQTVRGVGIKLVTPR
ncbi:response regulator transcription factor [Kitasatospora sp. NPDC048540]|uniref:response regulator transcription factor n=1 Tax=unclassified Kitasatospora TaxID=2633591 RepID=UPI000539B658|nr:response regulator transcription factor [Kitasatospora sp. MBT63]